MNAPRPSFSTRSLSSLWALPALSLSLVLASEEPASACGGCFHPPEVNTVVTGHRMAISISPTQTVLWDQIEYTGEPADFAWVLPIKPGARLELAKQAFFDALEAMTSARVRGPDLSCGGSSGCGFGCGASALAGKGANDQEEPVTVVSQQVVGPYETVTLTTDTPGALDAWLSGHGYSIDPANQPILDAYVAEGFDFIALRLAPGQGVRAMEPVRVVSSGANPTFPLRMVGAGTGPVTDLVLYVIGEGRWSAAGFADVDIDAAKLSWDWDASSSNFAELRQAALAQNLGHSLFTPYAMPGRLLEPYLGDFQLASGAYAQSFPDLYAKGLSATATCEPSAITQHVGDTGQVVDDCDADGNCVPVAAGQVAASAFACGEGSDLARALVGLHPADLWVTRLEGALPRDALAADLTLTASPQQLQRAGLFQTQLSTGKAPCASAALDAPWLGARTRDALAGVGCLLFGAGTLIGRRRRRANG